MDNNQTLHIGQRKVVTYGKQSYAVTIPYAFISAGHIKPGQRVRVTLEAIKEGEKDGHAF